MGEIMTETGDRGMNMVLATPPEDAGEAEGYAELYDLLVRIDASFHGERMTPAEFADWDAKAKSLLRSNEIERFTKPLRPHIPLSSDTIRHARNFHLTKILWARKGLEKLMTDTGY